MYRDTEQAYGDWTLDVFQDEDGVWYCDYWRRNQPLTSYGTVSGQRRKEVIAEAKRRIDAAAS